MLEPFSEKTAAFYGSFIKAAYRMYEGRPPDDPLHPPAIGIPYGYEMTAWVHMSDFPVFGEKRRVFYGFIARNTNRPYSSVMALRGTEGWLEWYDMCFQIPVRFRAEPSAGFVHLGIERIYGTIQIVDCQNGRTSAHTKVVDQVEDIVTNFTPPHAPAAPHADPSKHHSVVLTGHSLGGALCTLFAVAHAKKKTREGGSKLAIDTVCTFASPRVGMSDFTEAFDKLPINSWRIVNRLDIVPKIPPDVRICPFKHVETLYAFSSAGGAKSSPACWHSMNTYLHWLDPSNLLDPTCRTP